MDPQIGGSNWTKSFHYKSNSGVECGTAFYVSVVENEDLEFSIYPNPVRETLTVKANGDWSSYSIIGLDGQIISQGTTISQIDVSGLPQGIYILQLNHEGGSTVQKLSKL